MGTRGPVLAAWRKSASIPTQHVANHRGTWCRPRRRLAARPAIERTPGIQGVDGEWNTVHPLVLLLGGVLGSASGASQGRRVGASQRVRGRSPGCQRIWNSVVFGVVAPTNCVHMFPASTWVRALHKSLACSVLYVVVVQVQNNHTKLVLQWYSILFEKLMILDSVISRRLRQTCPRKA